VKVLRRLESQKCLKKKVREAAKQASKKATPMPKKTAENGVFFTGLTQIPKKEKLDREISAVIHNILLRVGCIPYYNDVIAIHPKNFSKRAFLKKKLLAYSYVQA